VPFEGYKKKDASKESFQREMKVNWRVYSSDIFVASAGFVIGLFIAGGLHDKWYYGGWMSLLGDPPDSNPSYAQLSVLFQKAPYVAGGFTCGFACGFGHFEMRRVFVRFMGVVACILLLLTKNAELTVSGFILYAVEGFATSVATSAVYFWLLARTRNGTVDQTAEMEETAKG